MKFYYEEFKKIRKMQNLSLQSIVSRINRSYKTVWSWEKGEHTPRKADIKLLSDILSVDISEISNLTDKDLFSHSKRKLEGLVESYNNDILGYLKSEVIRLTQQLKIQSKTINDLNKLLDSLHSYIYTKSKDLRFTNINTAFSSIIGFSKTDILGKYNHDLFSYPDTLILDKLEQEVLKEGVSILNREIFIPGSNRKKRGLVSLYPDYEGNSIISITSSIRDISEIKAAQERVKLLEDRRELLENVINQVAECVWVSERSEKSHYKYKKHLFISEGFENITGISKDLFIKNTMSLYDIMHPDSIAEVKQIHKTDSFPKHYEYKLIRQTDNVIRWIEENVYLSGNIIFGVMRDVTDQKTNKSNILK